MNYRLQDIMKMIIPGLYLMALILGYEILNSNFDIDTSKWKDLSAMVVLLIPFVGFVLGYFVDCVTAGIEHGWYALRCRRPSKNILKGSSKYPVANIEKIKTKHQLTSGKISNDKANEVLQTAKQCIPNKEVVEPYRNNATLARNIFGAQLIFTIIYAALLDAFYTEVYWYFLVIGYTITMCM